MKPKVPIIISTFISFAAIVYGLVFLVTSVCESYENHKMRHRPYIKQKKSMSREEWDRMGPKPTPPPSQSDRDKKDRQGGWKY